MPRTKKYSKRATRYVPRRRRYKKRGANSNNGSPFPLRTLARLKYVENCSTNPSAVNPAGIVFRANGIYDPNLSGTGHQPRGFDEYMSIYDRWVVIGGTLRVDVGPTTTPVMMYIMLNDSSTGILTNPTDYSESRNTKKILLSPNNGARTVYYKWNPNKFMGLPNPLSSSNVQGTDSASPQRQAYLHIAFVSLDGSDPNTIYYESTLTYSSIFHSPKKLIES